MPIGPRASTADPDHEPQQGDVANLLLRHTNLLVRNVVLIVEAGPVPQLTDTQKTQLIIAIGNALRDVSAFSRAQERKARP